MQGESEEAAVEAFAITVDRRDELTAYVRIVGEVDLPRTDEVDATFDRLIEAGVRRFYIDGSGIRFMDSMGLRSLLRLVRSGAGLDVVIQSPSPPVRRILQATGVDQVVTME